MLEGICKIVYEHAKDNFNVYTKYCTNQIYLDRTLRKLRQVFENGAQLGAQPARRMCSVVK